MATQADVRRIARALPDVVEGSDRFGFSVMRGGKAKGIAWVWLERHAPKAPRVPNPAVVAVRVANVAQRDLMIDAEPAKFFTEPHYNGFPAVLVRLAAVTPSDLEVLLAEAWRCQAGPRGRDGGSRRPPTNVEGGGATTKADRGGSDITHERLEAPMKKRGSTQVPDFSTRRQGSPAATTNAKGTEPRARPPRSPAVKPQATSSKSGRRGS